MNPLNVQDAQLLQPVNDGRCPASLIRFASCFPFPPFGPVGRPHTGLRPAVLLPHPVQGGPACSLVSRGGDGLACQAAWNLNTIKSTNDYIEPSGHN